MRPVNSSSSCQMLQSHLSLRRMTGRPPDLLSPNPDSGGGEAASRKVPGLDAKQTAPSLRHYHMNPPINHTFLGCREALRPIPGVEQSCRCANHGDQRHHSRQGRTIAEIPRGMSKLQAPEASSGRASHTKSREMAVQNANSAESRYASMQMGTRTRVWLIMVRSAMRPRQSVQDVKR